MSFQYYSRSDVAAELGVSYATLWRHEARGLVPPPRVIIGLGTAKITVPGWLPGDALAYRAGTLAKYDTVVYASKIELSPLFGVANSTVRTITHPPAILVNTRAGWSYSDIMAIASDRGWGITDYERAKRAGEVSTEYLNWGNTPWSWDYATRK